MMKWKRITEGNFSNARFVKADENIFKLIAEGNTKPWFMSTYNYDDEQKKQFDETNSVAGIRDVTTKMLWWDLDAKDIAHAQKSTLTLVKRLTDYGFSLDEIQIRYSGSKGFHVVIDTDTLMVPNQVEAIADKFAGDIEGYDVSLYDANQIMRIPLTLHPKTNVYCVPLTYEELSTMDVDELKENATDISGFDMEAYNEYYTTANLKEELLVEEKIEKKVSKDDRELTFDISEVDFTNRPKGIDKARWLLMNGYFRGSETADVGERNHAFLCLASTYSNMGYDREVVLGMLSGVAELQSQRTGESVFDEWELENNIVDQVFSSVWQGGQFSIKDKKSWLYKYAMKMDIDLSDNSDTTPSKLIDMAGKFTNFVKNIDKNTIKTGIEWLDEKMPIVIGSNVGLIGSSGSGKTSIALDILSNTSRAGVTSVFISLDMNSTRMFEKILRRVTGLSKDEIYHKYQIGEGEELTALVEADFPNVWFYDKTATTPEDIVAYIRNVEELTGEKVKLCMIDYFERVHSDMKDDTAASKSVAAGLQDIVNETDVAMITIVQPNKYSLSGGPNSPILDYTAIKGSSFLYQAFRQIFSLWRDFYTPQTAMQDIFMSMAVIKNDLGSIGTRTFNWKGETGTISEMGKQDKFKYDAWIAEMEEEKESNKGGNDGWS